MTQSLICWKEPSQADTSHSVSCLQSSRSRLGAQFVGLSKELTLAASLAVSWPSSAVTPFFSPIKLSKLSTSAIKLSDESLHVQMIWVQVLVLLQPGSSSLLLHFKNKVSSTATQAVSIVSLASSLAVCSSQVALPDLRRGGQSNGGQQTLVGFGPYCFRRPRNY